ncbi:MAG TPA: YqeG family HAD IIIA-type phosphatase [Stenomitos sp.]
MTTVLGLLRPNLWVGSVAEIDADHLRANGIRGLILDLDETLVSALDHTPSPEVHAWIREMKQGAFEVYIVSNNFNAARVQQVADELEVPCACRAAKPRRRGFREALAVMGLRPQEVAIVGDQVFTDILGGNRLGAYTILATPIAPEFKPWRKLMRVVEGIFMRDLDTIRHRVYSSDEKETP